MATQEEIRRQAFIQSMTPAALQWAQESGIDPAILLAIMGSESNFGNAPSLFGIKGSGSGGTASLGTHEVYGGQNVNLNDNFAVNKTADDAFHQFLDLISTSPRYADAWQNFKQTGDSAGLLAGINKAGYATDPNWHSLVTSIASNQVEPLLPRIPATANAAAPPPASPVSPLPAPAPQGGNAPMPPPTSNLTDLQAALMKGLQIDTQGVYSTYVIDPQGNEVHVLFHADGSNWVAFPFGSPEALQQNSALNAEYRAHGPPDTGGIPVVSGSFASGNPYITIAPGAATSTPPAGAGTATAGAGGTGGGNNATAQATNTITGGKEVPPTDARPGGEALATGAAAAGSSPTTATATNPAGSAPGTGGHVAAPKTAQEVALDQARIQASIPRPSGYIPQAAIPEKTGLAPADKVSDFMRSLNQTDQQSGRNLGTPYYSSSDPATANAIRLGGYPVLVSDAPGSRSVASPAGGLGYNPLAIQDAQKGLGSFNIPPPGSTVSAAQSTALQDNPYSANNPYEQARLSGGLVLPNNFITSGSGTTAGGQSFGPPPTPFSHGGGLQLRGPATLIDNATGQAIATFVDSQHQTPETLYDHGGSVSVMNHAARSYTPDNPNTGMIQRFDDGGGIDANFANAQQNASASAGATATPADQPAPASSPAPTGGLTSAAPVASAPAPAATTTNGLPQIPALPQAPVAPPLTVQNIKNGVDEGPMLNPLYSGKYGADLSAYEANLEAINAQGQADISGRRLAALNALDSPESQEQARQIAAAQRERDATDYKYPDAGLKLPVEVQPSFGQNGLQGGSLGPGLRWALLPPEQQYNLMNQRLGNISQTLSDQVNAAKALVAAQQAQQQAQLVQMGLASLGGSSSSSKSSGGGGGGGGSGGLAQNSFSINRGISG